MNASKFASYHSTQVVCVCVGGGGGGGGSLNPNIHV